MSDSDKDVIRTALHKWKVVFFRDQQLDHAAQIAFGAQFGKVTAAHPYEGDSAPAGFPQIHTVSPAAYDRRYGSEYRHKENRNGPNWHADVTPLINPPSHSILRAEVVPPYGGDTLFTNVAAVYQGLSPLVRGFIDGLRAEHRFGATLAFERSAERSASWFAVSRWRQSIRWFGCTPRPTSAWCMSTSSSPRRSSTCPRGRVVTSWTCCSSRSLARSIRFDSSGSREALRSGTIGPRCISRRATSSISITSACCIGSRWSATSRSARTGAHRSRWRASSSGPPDRAWTRPHGLRCDHSRPSSPNAATAVVVSATGHNAPPTWATTEVSSNGMSPPMMVELWPDNDIPV
ncbi:taurine dioxygenase [Mycobacterium sp. H4Y]|nr:taurine dioxygenase [Mycobacterium sp. H4Y]